MNISQQTLKSVCSGHVLKLEGKLGRGERHVERRVGARPREHQVRHRALGPVGQHRADAVALRHAIRGEVGRLDDEALQLVVAQRAAVGARAANGHAIAAGKALEEGLEWPAFAM
eukprot:3587871-Prymnesium_polylepis.1